MFKISPSLAALAIFAVIFLEGAPALVAYADASSTPDTVTADTPTENTVSSDADATVSEATSTPSSAENDAGATLDEATSTAADAEADASSTPAGESEATDTPSVLNATPPGPDADVEVVLDTATSSTGFETGTTATTTQVASTTPDTAALSGAATTTASSTDSETASSTPLSAIVTGTAQALVNILNILNTTFVNSLGSILFSNLTDGNGRVDLRDSSLFSGQCGTEACAGQEGVLVNLLQDATIDNDVLVSASSGGNSTMGTSTIATGDAYAGLNLINLANTTFINSDYLLAALNAFTGVNGDIVFPSLLDFENDLSHSSSTAAIDGLSATGSVENDVTASADAGDNSVSGGSDSLITTGSGNAYTNIYNDVNSVVGSSLAILFRISGAWNGNIYGLPDSVSMVRGDDGSIFLFTPHPDMSEAEDALNTVEGTTTSDIANRVTVAATTGENDIENAGSSLIATGNAEAAANIVNVANQTVIGKNWILAIVNIFGDFNGNISFGMPDLWVGDRVVGPAFVSNGSELDYTLTVTNRGDAPATGVTLTETPSDLVSFESASATPAQNGNVFSWDLGTLLPGQTVEVKYTATAKPAPGGTDITNHTTVSENEPDNNSADNTDSATIETGMPSQGGIVLPSSSYAGGAGSAADFSPAPLDVPALTVQRVPANLTVFRSDATTTEHLVITNDSGTDVTDAVMRDNLYGPDGFPVHTEVWQLGTVKAGEEMDIEYEFSFGPSAPLGTYWLTTSLESTNAPQVTADNGAILLTPPLAPLAVSAPAVFPFAPHLAALPTHVRAAAKSEVLGTSTRAAFLGIENGPTPPKEGMPLPSPAVAAGTLFGFACALFAAMRLKKEKGLRIR